uniref:Apple domain-containing protein n=1 Tax=Knipowitschia caucasica TaxID=637954 RepID=A0AAV2MA47_KNICA
MERTLSLALISLCIALCLGQGSVPRCDMELYEDEEFVSRRYDQNNHSPSARHCQLMCTQNPDCHKYFSKQLFPLSRGQ